MIVSQSRSVFSDRVYNNAKFTSEENQFSLDPVTELESEWASYKQHGVDASATTSSITITNYHSGKTVVVVQDGLGIAPSSETGTGKTSIYYSYIIFNVEDYTNGKGLWFLMFFMILIKKYTTLSSASLT